MCVYPCEARAKFNHFFLYLCYLKTSSHTHSKQNQNKGKLDVIRNSLISNVFIYLLFIYVYSIINKNKDENTVQSHFAKG